jgi:exodeoxyribonuclease VII large subunit
MVSASAQASNLAEYTVSELSFAIKRTMEDAFGLVRLRGEISGFRGVHSSGHCYFSLKDERTKIEAVIWRGVFGGLKFKPEEGLEVIVTGRITTFPGKSSYQIVIETLEPAGAGALMALLEDRKKKLAAEGLFEQSRKRKLPFWPQVIGIVTSPTGAVIRDMLYVFADRCPAHVIVWPVRVQGETCASEVAAAITGFNAMDISQPQGLPRPELLIVARGGGSLEDLWGFNEEAVARAVAASRIPVISAVGHETDWTLIDYVADERAPTPTKAAECALPKRSDIHNRLADCVQRVRHCLRRILDRVRSDLKGAERGLPKAQSLLHLPRQRLDHAGGRLGQSLRHFSQQSRSRLERISPRLHIRLITQRLLRCHEHLKSLHIQQRQAYRSVQSGKHRQFVPVASRFSPRLPGLRLQHAAQKLGTFDERLARGFRRSMEIRAAKLSSQEQLLRSLSHKSVLERGFALVRDEHGAMIRRAANVKPDAANLEIEFADGSVTAHIQGRELEKRVVTGYASPAMTGPRRPPVKQDSGGQGSLL